METLTFVLLLLLLTLASAYFSGSEVALFSLPELKVHTFSQSTDSRQRRVAELLNSPRDLLVTIFILNTLVNILIQNIASHIFRFTPGWTFKVGFPLVLTLLLGEIIPKYVSLHYNITIAQAVAPSINFLQNLLSPVRRWTIAITSPISRLLFFFLRKEPGITKEEVEHALKTAHQQKILTDQEIELVQGYVDLLDADISDIMRPKDEILYYDIHTPLSKLTHLFADEKCTRIPVCDKYLDNILGILSANAYFVGQTKFHEGKDIVKVLQKPIFIPEQTPARLLIKRFFRENEQFSLVVDEYGNLTGLITLEDLAEVVIGSVTDSRDQKALYSKAGKNEIIASGRLELDELNEIFDTDLESDNVVTVGGWLIEQLDGFPAPGTKYEKDGLLFQVIAVLPRKIERVLIQKKNSPQKPKGSK
ncbi:MAG: hemolysin family protein [Parachlamydiales bacterium]|jgi:CBS domain containing-hemolysin-like protein